MSPGHRGSRAGGGPAAEAAGLEAGVHDRVRDRSVDLDVVVKGEGRVAGVIVVMAAVTLTHVPLFVHTFARIVEVVPAALSLSVAVAQSYVRVSGQVILYQNESVPPAAGAVKVWAMELSPLVGLVEPARAA